MKKLLFLFFSTVAICCYSQNLNRRDSILIDMQEQIWDIQKKVVPRYKIIPTENVYVLLRLNTATGQIDIMQWSLDRKDEFINSINSVNLSNSLTIRNGNFELYPTKNMFQFILIDTSDGRCWHVQWGFETKERWIRRISK